MQAKKATKTSSDYPQPLVIAPHDEHKQTFILLHGRGSNGRRFGLPLLDTPLGQHLSLRDSFPNAKFIFPTAARRRATVWGRSQTHQWFDNWDLKAPTEREELQNDGLRETTRHIHALLRQAIAEVGADNVFLGGLSQGCAASLIALLTWEGEPLTAVVGMCGWLPYRSQLERLAHGQPLEDKMAGENPFGEEPPDGTPERSCPTDPIFAAVSFLREELVLPAVSDQKSFQQISIFLGHGTEDLNVPMELGRDAAGCLKALGMRVKWTEYTGLGHWYSSEMLKDLVTFLGEKFRQTPG